MIELAMWANIQAEYAGYAILVSGILGISIPFRDNEFAIYAIAASVFIVLFEYPRSKRSKGSNVPRPHQEYLAPMVYGLGFLGRNYFVRFVLYLLMAIPLFFFLPTMLAGIFLFCASVTYFAAALRGEQWSPVKLAWGKGKSRKEVNQRGRVINPPAGAPPRHPPQ
eukprot:scpid96117/ scgid31411/ Cytochrome b-245 light chain; Cytochrome b(558) alpha chain; Cytochrome b558 subunit alpha; Neutrophil cytochrome b 22 kDa polypeptide; Superoxide-generating NADPH oxidase light chain subunit; p22 phagocyte B-cytochrome; p22-phox